MLIRRVRVPRRGVLVCSSTPARPFVFWLISGRRIFTFPFAPHVRSIVPRMDRVPVSILQGLQLASRITWRLSLAP